MATKMEEQLIKTAKQLSILRKAKPQLTKATIPKK